MSSFDPFPKFAPIPIVFHGYHYDGKHILDDKALMISSSLTTAFGKFINSNVVREWYFNKSLSDSVILKKIKLIMINVLEDRCSRSSTVERNSVTEMITELVDNCQVMVKVGGKAYHEINGTNSFRLRINKANNAILAFHLVPKRMFRRSITIDFDPFNVSHYTTKFEDSDEKQGIIADLQLAAVDLLAHEQEEETETAASAEQEAVVETETAASVVQEAVVETETAASVVQEAVVETETAASVVAQEQQAAAAIEEQTSAFDSPKKGAPPKKYSSVKERTKHNNNLRKQRLIAVRGHATPLRRGPKPMPKPIARERRLEKRRQNYHRNRAKQAMGLSEVIEH